MIQKLATQNHRKLTYLHADGYHDAEIPKG